MGVQDRFQDNFRMSPLRLAFEKACHLPIELEHQALWAIKQLYFDLDKADDL